MQGNYSLNDKMTEQCICVSAQLNYTVGDFQGNAGKILAAAKEAKNRHDADLVVFSELALSGYPPEDLLYRSDFPLKIAAALQQLQESLPEGLTIIIGYPEFADQVVYNAALAMTRETILAKHRKYCLPNEGVFDEKRYFTPGTSPTVFSLNGLTFGLLICEDIWHAEPIQYTLKANIHCLITINASPYEKNKHAQRWKALEQFIFPCHVPVIYVNQVGGQDELIFDGRSMVIDQEGKLVQRAKHCEEDLLVTTIHRNGLLFSETSNVIKENKLAEIYAALVLGVRDYVNKNGFNHVCLGLSGGIDSALTLTIAVDALGREKVTTVMMPSIFTADISKTEAEKQAHLLGVNYLNLPIEEAFEAFNHILAPVFKNMPDDIAEQNLQARCRGTLLMALSNKFGWLVLTTSNKSETAVGYSTLYGDMAGGFCVLKDVYKTLVYELANYRNEISLAIPQAVIDRPPTAELAHGQQDSDSLPDYSILDRILELYLEKNYATEDIINCGFERNVVEKVIKMVKRNEYKRRQAPLGSKITSRNFGKDWRYPISNKF